MSSIHLAYISPVNPIPSGISDYSEALIPELTNHMRLTVYTDTDKPSNQFIVENLRHRSIEALPRHRSEHDLCLFQLGNSAHSATAFDAFRRLPGVVTLHEPFLHTGIRAIGTSYYCRELGYEFGSTKSRVVAERFWIENDMQNLLHYPMLGRVLDLALGLIVHSSTARKVVEREWTDRSQQQRRKAPDIVVIPPLMPLLKASDPQAHRAEFDLPTEALIVGVAGLVDPTKEPELVMYAFAQMAAMNPNAQLVFIGELPAWYTSLPALALDLGVSARVTFMDRVEPLERMHRAMAACDVIINLRKPTIGETSSTALRALSLGRPLVVRNVGWYSELPDAACVKISESADAPELARALERLNYSVDLRRRMGEAGRSYIKRECDVSVIATQHTAFLTAVRDRIMRRSEKWTV